jgi:hypothetical protein
VLLFTSAMPHLEAAILLPCLGAAATIWAGDKTRASELLTNRPMIAVGAISYSLYLCHWPIIFFGRFIFGGAANAPAGVVTMAILMIAVATAMNLLIERRFIQPSGFKSPCFLKYAAGFCSVILGLAAITHMTFLSKGFTWRLQQDQLELAHLQDFPTFERDMPVTDAPVGFLLVGDSLAGQYIAGFGSLTKRLNMGFEVLAGAGCPMLYGVTLKAVRRQECKSARDRVLERLGQTTLPIIYTQKWRFYNDATIDYELSPAGTLPAADSFTKLQLALENTLEKLVDRGHRILIIGDPVQASCSINRPRLLQGPLPHTPEPPCLPVTREAAERSTAQVDGMLSRIQARWPSQVELLRPADHFCDMQCPVVKDGVWLYYDRIHLTVAGSRYMVDRASDAFRKFLGK